MKTMMFAVLAMLATHPASAQQVAPQMSLDQSAPSSSCRRLTARDPVKVGADKTVRIGCMADGRIVSTMASDSISVAEFGASVSATGAANRDAFNATIAALPSSGGRIVLPGSGNYAVTLPLTGTKPVVWDAPQGATVNGSASPHILGRWRNGPEEIEFTRGSGDVNLFTLGPGSFRQILEPGAVGHFEAAHVEADASGNGSVGKFIVGVQAIGRTNSSGNIFGLGGYAHAQPNTASTAEISGGEFNTEVQAPVVTRKTGLQIVDASGSVGYGLAMDSGLFISRQAGAVGYNDGIVFGDGIDAHFPLKNGTDNALIGARGGTDITIGYGFSAGSIFYAQSALALRSQFPGHRLSWGIGGLNNREGGEIRSDASARAGKIIFISGGLVVQNALGANALAVLDAGVVMFQPVRIISTGSGYAATTNDHLIVVRKASGSATTITLPSSPSAGNQIIVKDGKGDAASNNITITGGTIDGAAMHVIAINRGSARLTFDGAEWVLM